MFVRKKKGWGRNLDISRGTSRLLLPAALLLVFMISCSSSSTDRNTATYTIGGTVSGLNGTLVLHNNGGNALPVSSSGSFVFNASLATGRSYSVTVPSQPAAQTCTVTNGSGTVNAASITNIQIACSNNTYAVGGTVSGLNGTLVLRNNGGDDLSVSANGSFTFSTALNNETAYSVTVSSQPSLQICTIVNGSGTIQTANVTNVQVSCALAGSDPKVTVSFPPAISMTYGDTVRVSGTISGGIKTAALGTAAVLTQSLNGVVRASSEDTVLTSISVNGVPAETADGYQTWEAEVPLDIGTSILKVETNLDPAAARIAIARHYASNESIAIDSANNRVLGVDKFSKTIFAVDLSTGTNTILSDSKTPSAVNPLHLPSSIAIDSSNNRALVVDYRVVDYRNVPVIVAVNLQTGARTILSDNMTPNFANPFRSLGDIAVDSANNRALVADYGLNAVVAVNLSTGVRTILSDDITPNADNPFSSPRWITIDRENDRALVVDLQLHAPSALHAVIAVDLATGTRTILSDNTTPNVINQFFHLTDITIDNVNNRALVTDHGNAAIIAVDLDTGARIIISDSETPDSGNILYYPKSIAVDDENNRALIADAGGNVIIAMDLDSGTRTMLIENTTPDSENKFISPLGVAIDGRNDRALVVEGTRNEIIAVDLETGTRTVLSNNTTPNDFYPFINIEAGVAIDSENNRALVADIGRSAVIAVDLETGARTIFLSNITTDTTKPFFPSGIAIDGGNNRALIVDRWNNAIIAVDFDSGNHVVLSDNATPAAGIPFQRISDGIVVDAAHDRALVVDTEADAIIAVDLETGARTILSNSATPDALNPFLGLFGGMAIDSVYNRALVMDSSRRAVIAVDLSTGARTIVSDYSSDEAANPILFPYGIAVDTVRNRILATDGSIMRALFAIDPVNGERVIFSK
jgi:sugar lactone lactonase YvrE